MLFVVGHSLGGLITRWALGYLYSEGHLSKVTPGKFMSICSPHCGVKAPKSQLKRVVINFAKVLSPTEKQLVFADNETEPMLAILADPTKPYFQALSLFSTRYAVGVADYDMLVPSASACICAGTVK